jgi:hypothetical protein
MSFIPAADFYDSSLLTPAWALPSQFGVMSNTPAQKRTATLRQTTASLTSRMFKRQLPRARKARVRLRQQHKLRLAVVRTN